LEIAHVLFMDIVGYSKLLINDQSEILVDLNQLVRDTTHFREAEAAGKLIRLPTGDGMALVFLNHAEAPVECALEISESLESHPHIQLRMGVHSGPINPVSDVNDRANVAGAGINMAQRVMDCGDAAHILLSRRAAEDLQQYRQWQPYLHDLGECEVKHGVRVHVFNLYTKKLGNPNVPAKLQRVIAPARASPRSKRGLFVAATLATAALILGLAFWAMAYRAIKSRNSSALSGASVAPGIPEKSIAVLPFENLSDEKENAFFADGVQDDILTSLAQIGDLKVISRTSVMQYRSATRNLREIANALGVANILEGSVRRSGNRVLLNVQLIDAHNDRHIWAERYDRTIADSIGLQGELATEIAKALQAKLAPNEKTSLETKATNNPEAYVLYLRALEIEENAQTVDDLKTADPLYAQAIALDPRFALAHARASMNYTQQFWQTHNPALKAKARTLADEALRLSPTLGEGHLALGFYFYLAEENYTTALEQLTIALTALPNNVEALLNIAKIYRRQGRWREAIASFERARSLNPLVEPAELVRTLWMVRDWPATSAAIKRNLQRQPPRVPFAKISLADIEVVANRNLAAAKAWLQEIPAGVDPDGEVTLANWNLSMLERDWAAAEKRLASFPSDEFADAGPKSFYQAQVALARGDVELAHTLFEKVRPGLESDVRDRPHDSITHAALGRLYAYMGRKQDAIREARQGVELSPEKTDALNGVQRACDLALVYALTGEADQAVTLIERLVRTPGATLKQQFFAGGITQAELRLRWQWDALRSNPGFKKIVEGPEPKTNY
jgi:TolB-like protein/class 3 adenylate cyclase/Flp pilus assembly protein TadD